MCFYCLPILAGHVCLGSADWSTDLSSKSLGQPCMPHLTVGLSAHPDGDGRDEGSRFQGVVPFRVSACTLSAEILLTHVGQIAEPRVREGDSTHSGKTKVLGR